MLGLASNARTYSHMNSAHTVMPELIDLADVADGEIRPVEGGDRRSGERDPRFQRVNDVLNTKTSALQQSTKLHGGDSR